MHTHSIECSMTHDIKVVVPEWLSGMTRNHVGFARAGSNPADHAFLIILHYIFSLFNFVSKNVDFFVLHFSFVRTVNLFFVFNFVTKNMNSFFLGTFQCKNSEHLL